MTIEVCSSLHRPRAHSPDQIPYGKPVVMEDSDVEELQLDTYGFPHADGLEGDVVLVTHISPFDPDATPLCDNQKSSVASTDSSSSPLIDTDRPHERRVVRFHRRDFEKCPSCTVTADELATLELMGPRSFRPDLLGWHFDVSPRANNRYEIRVSPLRQVSRR